MSTDSRRFGFTLIEVLVSLAVTSILFGLLLVGLQAARDAAGKIHCFNNVKQIGLAISLYHDTYGRMPAGCSFLGGRDPYPHISWCAKLLPYLDQDSLWRDTLQAYEKASFFESVPPHRGLGTVIPVFTCPVDPISQEAWDFKRFQVAFTSYVGVEGTDQFQKDGVLYLNSRVSFTDIKDGASNTIIIAERPPSGRMNFGWWYAGWGQAKDGSAEMVLGSREKAVHRSLRNCSSDAAHFQPGNSEWQCDVLHYWSHHAGGASFCFGDGSVRFLRYEADTILPALSTRSGGEVVGSHFVE
jgi:prepilin-type N-terminal cleavage/methylation domain-containing protein/prepilin-type processing-associated H-X9-DG protein